MKAKNAFGTAAALAAAWAFLNPGVALAAPGPFMDLALRAIDSQNGSASRRFDQAEQWVLAMRRQLGTQGPVTVTSNVVHRFQQDGCARIQTIFQVHDAALKEGRYEDLKFSLNFNTCRDGQPPLEALDLREVERVTSPDPSVSMPPRGLPPIVPFDQPNSPARANKPRSPGNVQLPAK